MDGMMKLNDNEKKVREILHIPEDEKVRTAIPFGRPLEPVVQKEKKPVSERAKIIQLIFYMPAVISLKTQPQLF